MITATYSPEDNKLRLYSSTRLDAETYKRVKAAGFAWAPKQELFVAPMWTPSREDLCLELAGEIGDEDTSLVERAETRSERFSDYSEARASDAEQAKKAVTAIADNIPFGQPILVGHHSERHARRDAERIENGMRKAVKMWATSEYWKDRAAGAVRHAKYKELPSVRARRIKGLEADQRKYERELRRDRAGLAVWNKVSATPEAVLNLAGMDSGAHQIYMDLHYGKDGEKPTPEQAIDRATRCYSASIAWNERWLAHVSNRLEYERAMLASAGGIVADRNRPEIGGGCHCWASPRGGWSYIVKVNRVSVTVEDNWGNGGANFTRIIPFDKLAGIMSKAEVDVARQAGKLIESADKTGFYIAGTLETEPTRETPKPEPKIEAQPFEAMRETLRQGVQTVCAPQLFPTPPALAMRMTSEAGIRPGHRVLEPSAGTGNLLREIARYHAAEVKAVEVNPRLTGLLTQTCASVSVKCGDFLQCNGDLGKFDRIVMNPPFEDGADIKHITHALAMLKPGGRLVAICANGPRQNEQLKPFADMWEELPAGTFDGTGVRAVLLTVDAAAPTLPLTQGNLFS